MQKGERKNSDLEFLSLAISEKCLSEAKARKTRRLVCKTSVTNSRIVAECTISADMQIDARFPWQIMFGSLVM